MLTAKGFRRIALGMKDAVESAHMGHPDFRNSRNRGKIFATLWNEGRVNVMVDEGGIRTAIAAAPEACEEVWWGKRLAAVGVALARVERDHLGELLEDAWEQKAPKRLLPR